MANNIQFTLPYVMQNYSFTEDMIDAAVNEGVLHPINRSSHGKHTKFYPKVEIENLAHEYYPDPALKKSNDKERLAKEIEVKTARNEQITTLLAVLKSRIVILTAEQNQLNIFLNEHLKSTKKRKNNN